ncbi:MAG: hypothetical protein AAFR59_11295, partial [Bacteroidota bacterium]
MTNEQATFAVRGRVTSIQQKRGLAGLRVEIKELDFTKEEFLGKVQTDAEGYFQLTFAEKDFTHSKLEQEPDLVVQVFNDQEDLIWTSKILQQAANTTLTVNAQVDEDMLVTQFIPNTRTLFPQFLAINPNYFGTWQGLPKDAFQPVIPISGNTTYEGLCGVGLNTHLDLLEAIIEVKQPTGYGTNQCLIGSMEYVSFFVDYLDGNGWQPTGSPASVKVHNHPSAAKGGLCYAVRKKFNPTILESCKSPQIVRVRAILSWNQLPTPENPNFVPVWGEVVDKWVQIRPKKLSSLTLVPPPFPPTLPIPTLDITDDIIQTPSFFAPPTLSLSGTLEELQEIVKFSSDIQQPEDAEESRFNFLPLIQENPNYFGTFSLEQEPNLIQNDISAFHPQVSAQLQEWGLDNLAPILPQIGNTDYE